MWIMKPTQFAMTTFQSSDSHTSKRREKAQEVSVISTATKQLNDIVQMSRTQAGSAHWSIQSDDHQLRKEARIAAESGMA
jgi:hypothetical protein